MSRTFRSLAFIASNTDEAQASCQELIRLYGHTEPAEADVIVALGGDGFMLAIKQSGNKDIEVLFRLDPKLPPALVAKWKKEGRYEREVKELRKANEILKLASAFFAQAELDRRLKS